MRTSSWLLASLAASPLAFLAARAEPLPFDPSVQAALSADTSLGKVTDREGVGLIRSAAQERWRAAEEQQPLVAGDWLKIAKLWEGGLVFYGGLIGCVGVSVPYVEWPGPPTQLMRMVYGDRFFYILYFQQVGPPEAELGANARATMAQVLYGASGPAVAERWQPGQEVVYVRNDDWKNGPMPKIRRVIMRIIPSAGNRRALLEQIGRAHV